MKKQKPLSKRDQEINRLVAALRNFLSFGYDGEYQKRESAIEQLTKMEKLARKDSNHE